MATGEETKSDCPMGRGISHQIFMFIKKKTRDASKKAVEQHSCLLF